MLLAMFDAELINDTTHFLQSCRDSRVRIAVAESCTGGLVSALFTDIAGSSDVFDRGFVTYSNDAKVELLGVDARLIAMHGAVSELASLAMAEGALERSRADITVSITGIAGPNGGSAEKPVGLVHFGCAKRGGTTIHDHEVFGGTRAEIRMEAVRHALRLLKSRV